MSPVERHLVRAYEEARRDYAEYQPTGDPRADSWQLGLLKMELDDSHDDLAAHVRYSGEVETDAGMYCIGPDGRLRYVPFRAARPLGEGAMN